MAAIPRLAITSSLDILERLHAQATHFEETWNAFAAFVNDKLRQKHIPEGAWISLAVHESALLADDHAGLGQTEARAWSTLIALNLVRLANQLCDAGHELFGPDPFEPQARYLLLLEGRKITNMALNLAPFPGELRDQGQAAAEEPPPGEGPDDPPEEGRDDPPQGGQDDEHSVHTDGSVIPLPEDHEDHLVHIPPRQIQARGGQARPLPGAWIANAARRPSLGRAAALLDTYRDCVPETLIRWHCLVHRGSPLEKDVEKTTNQWLDNLPPSRTRSWVALLLALRSSPDPSVNPGLVNALRVKHDIAPHGFVADLLDALTYELTGCACPAVPAYDDAIGYISSLGNRHLPGSANSYEAVTSAWTILAGVKAAHSVLATRAWHTPEVLADKATFVCASLALFIYLAAQLGVRHDIPPPTRFFPEATLRDLLTRARHALPGPVDPMALQACAKSTEGANPKTRLAAALWVPYAHLDEHAWTYLMRDSQPDKASGATAALLAGAPGLTSSAKAAFGSVAKRIMNPDGRPATRRAAPQASATSALPRRQEPTKGKAAAPFREGVQATSQ